MSEDLLNGIVRILLPDGGTAGTGFVVSDDGLVATCSHVIQVCEAQKPSETMSSKVTLVFTSTGDTREAMIEPDWWRPSAAEDVAILRVEGDMPTDVKRLLLGSSAGTSGH